MMQRFSFLSVFLLGVVSFTHAATDLSEAITKLAGEDHRLVRWDASEDTVEQQKTLCPDIMKDGVDALVSGKTLQSAMQALVLCITDNPENRVKFSETKAVYSSVVDALKKKESKEVVAAAGNLIWIAVYGNPTNHAGFLQAGAIDALANVVTTSDYPASIMWASAALQNLAASYCDSDENAPHCTWEHPEEDMAGDVSITADSGTVLIDATDARKSILASPNLVDRLIELACQGPVKGELEDENPYPGLNAVVTTDEVKHAPHEESATIIPWAATGALKNLVLDPTAKVLLEPHLLCLCRLSQSYDWLESAKVNDLLFFLRPSFPCWFDWESEGVEPATVPTCIDQVFVDKNGSTCYEYEYGSEAQYCEQEDVKSKVLASVACCGCGGGTDHGIGFKGKTETADEL